MSDTDVKMLIGLGILAVLVVLFFTQIHRIWKVRIVMRNFLQEIVKLNENLENIITYIQGKEKTAKKSDRKICKYCAYRQTFVEPEAKKLFMYQCKIDNRNISLKDTCKRFTKDLQNTQL